jgi:hypothetical protein
MNNLLLITAKALASYGLVTCLLIVALTLVIAIIVSLYQEFKENKNN